MREHSQHQHKHENRQKNGGSRSKAPISDTPSGAQMVLDYDRFESEAGSLAEDVVRSKGLATWMPIVPPVGWTNIGAVLRRAAAYVPGRPTTRLSRRKALALIRKLDPETEPLSTTLASAVAMRRIRVDVIGALIDALAHIPDEELCTITIVKPTWVFTAEELARIPAWVIKDRFEQDLKRTGAASIDGPFVAFLHGEYEPTNGVFVLHFHCVTTREKAAILVRELRALKRAYRPSKLVKRPIRVSKMGNRVGQLMYLLKRYWPSRPILVIDGKEVRRRDGMRVDEPFSSAYLLWLDAQPQIDLTVMNCTWSKRLGGSALWKTFYVFVTKHGKTMRSRGGLMPKLGQLTASGTVSTGSG